MNTLFAFFDTLAIGLALPLLAAPHITVTSHDGRVSFQTGSVTMSGAWPEVELAEDRGKASFFLRPEGKPTVTSGRRSTPAGEASFETYRWNSIRGFSFTWTVSRLRDRPGFTLQSSFENRSRSSVRLQNLWIARSAEGALTVKGAPENWWLQAINPTRRNGNLAQLLPSIAALTATKERVFVSTMNHEKTGPRANDGHWRIFQDFATLYTNFGERGITIGAVGPAQSFVFIDARVAEGKLRLEIVSEMDGVRVDPGESRWSEEVLFLAEPYHEAVTTLFRWLASTHGARLNRGPIFGWCSWYDRGITIDARHVENVTAAIAKNYNRLPMQVIQIDSGWEQSRGEWEVDRYKFPAGLAPLASKIREIGAIPGIWMSPVLTERPPRNPAWGEGRGLDATNPEVQQFIRTMIRDRTPEGYRYFKFDFTQFLTFPIYDQKLTRFQSMRNLFRLYREAIGEDSYMLACVGMVLRPVLGFADAARIGTDAKPRWTMPPALDGLPGDNMNISDCIRSVGATALANGILHANDPDPTYTPEPPSKVTPKRFTLPEIRTWHSFVGLLGGLMMVSEPLDAPEFKDGGDMTRLIEILDPPAPDKAYSLYGGTDPWHQHFGFLARRPWGNFASLVVYNRADHSADFQVETRAFPALGSEFHVWSFWDEKYLGVQKNGFRVRQLAAHGPALLRLTAVTGHGDVPVLVGSTLHIAMGSEEIKGVEASPDGITITLTDGGARDGKLFLFSSGTLRLEENAGCEASLASVQPNVWSIEIRGRKRGTLNRVRLSRRS